MYEGRQLRVAVRFNGGDVKVLEFQTGIKSEDWFDGIHTGLFQKDAEFELSEEGRVEIDVRPLDPGMAISRVEVY